jgi:Putative transmembrane protein (PGPGW)
MTCTWYPMPLGGATVPVGASRARGALGARGVQRAGLRRFGRRLLVGLTGGLAVAAGLVMLVLPGPGLVTIALGFGVLGREFTWAARANARVRARLDRVGRVLTDN